MSDVPETIWAWYDKGYEVVTGSLVKRPHEPSVEYRRADLPAPPSVEPVTVQEAAKVLLADDKIVKDLATQTRRNNRWIDGKRIGYYPALLAAPQAIAGGHDE